MKCVLSARSQRYQEIYINPYGMCSCSSSHTLNALVVSHAIFLESIPSHYFKSPTGNPHEVVADQCALVEELKDEAVMKTVEEYTSVVIVQTPKVAPETEPEAELAAEEKPEPNHVKKTADFEEGKKVDELGDETKEENGKEEVENVDEITEKINGVGIEKEEEAGKENDAAKEKPDSDEKNGKKEVNAEANADGNEEEK